MKVGYAALVVLALGGCDKLKSMMNKDSGASSTTTTSTSTSTTPEEDSGSLASAEDAAAEAAAPAANEADIKRFPDEEADTDAVSVQWTTVDAKTEPGTGKLVTALPKGTSATLVARKGKTVLARFQDPKDATKTLMGWIPEDAFTPGTTPPPVVVVTGTGAPKTTGVCPAGLVLLFDADAFCGKACKADKDCTAPLTCTGTAKPLTGGGFGAPVTFCAKPLAKPDAGAPKPTPAGADAGPSSAPKPDAGAATVVRPADAGTTVVTPLTTARPVVR